MWQINSTVSKFGFVVFLLALLGGIKVAKADSWLRTEPAEGIRGGELGRHALVGGAIVSRPGTEPRSATVLVTGDVLRILDSQEPIPAGYRHWDLTGKIVYPGFIDAYSSGDAEEPESAGTRHWNRYVRPERDMSISGLVKGSEDESFRKVGVVARVLVPKEGIIKGQSALISTGSRPFSDRVLAPRVAMHLRLTVPRNRDRDYYPNSPMGAVALARQVFLDSDWYQSAWTAFRSRPGTSKPETNQSLEVLASARRRGLLFVTETSNEQFFLRADRFSREFSLPTAILGSGREYRRLEAIRRTGRSVILPINFPKPPDVTTPDRAAQSSLADLMHWHLAPENPGRLDGAGVPIVLTSHGLKNRGDFLKMIREAVKRGLGAHSALAALTTRPAQLLGVDDKYGTLENGKIANLVIADGELFADKTELTAVWIQGQRFGFQDSPAEPLVGHWQLQLNDQQGLATGALSLVIEVKNKKPSIRIESLKAEESGEKDTVKWSLKDVKMGGGIVSGRFSAALWEDVSEKENVRLTATLLQTDRPFLVGELIRSQGERIAWEARRRESQGSGSMAEKTAVSASTEEKVDEININFPLGAFGLSTQPAAPAAVVIENATIWTSGPLGTIPRASILIENGRITEIGASINAPSGATRIDAAGRHVTPGIIDCHSHMATDGGVNESGQANTAEVRIGDFIDANDINIYRQLAGGVTCANILHGSANPIGGQNQVIKLRWGGLPDDLRFDQAPPGIKFALGENVKQSNRGNEYTTRYPQTRMGVEQYLRDAFRTAKAYGDGWSRWRNDAVGLPPRRDLELEALWEIMDGKRWLHCHSYRQDEILALIRVLDDYGIRIGTFQHILEGYKVAPEMQRHGAMASAFSDWWAYKFEVLDAIPYNGALMHEAGLVVSFNSDDRELARHLNQEAAKAVKYGGVSPEEALKFVTLNPAKQLRVDQYVGSLEVGKQADFVIWSGSPLSNMSRCEQTWIDGRCYFSLQQDAELRREASQWRETLVRKILTSGQEMAKPGEKPADESGLWPRDDLFCHPHRHEGHDHGE